jgi:hypothetical protein
VVARSEDGVHFETATVLAREDFTCDSLERPALVRLDDGTWRIYVSCATPGTWHWRVDALDADHPADFSPDSATTVFAGDESVGMKDPVVKLLDGRWHAWVCCHPLDLPDDTGRWDQRGARVADVVQADGRWLAYYDGRATKEENAEERTGLAAGDTPGHLIAGDGPFGAGADGLMSMRYLSVVPLPDGGERLYYETSRRDGAHDLRTEYVPPTR